MFSTLLAAFAACCVCSFCYIVAPAPALTLVHAAGKLHEDEYIRNIGNISLTSYLGAV
jgi:hypothetical protein